MSTSLSVLAAFFFQRLFLLCLQFWWVYDLSCQSFTCRNGPEFHFRVFVQNEDNTGLEQGESCPCCDLGAPAGGCGFKGVVKDSAALQFGSTMLNYSLECLFTYWTRVHEYGIRVLMWLQNQTCKSWEMPGYEFSHPLAHVPCDSVFYYTVAQSAFSPEFLHPSVHGMPVVVSKKIYSIFCFLLVAPHDHIQAAQWGRNCGCPHSSVLFFAHFRDCIRGQCFMSTLCSFSCLILDAVLTPFTNHGNAGTLRICFGPTALPSGSDFIISIILLIPSVPFQIPVQVFSSSYLALKNKLIW